MTTLILVRHGQSEANLDKCFAGQTNPDLTQMGHEQAEALSTWIIENFKIIMCSAEYIIAEFIGCRAAEIC